MIDKVETPQSVHHPKLVRARRRIESAQKKLKEDPMFTQTDFDVATRDFLTDRLRYDKLDSHQIAGIKSRINNINEQLAEAEVAGD